MSKLLGLSLVLGVAVLGISGTASAGHGSGCHTNSYDWPSQAYHQPSYGYYSYQAGHYYQPGYYQPAAPRMSQVPGTQTYRGFSYEPGSEAATPMVATQANVPATVPSYQGTYSAPQRFGGSSRPSYFDAGRKIRGNFGR